MPSSARSVVRQVALLVVCALCACSANRLEIEIDGADQVALRDGEGDWQIFRRRMTTAVLAPPAEAATSSIDARAITGE